MPKKSGVGRGDGLVLPVAFGNLRMGSNPRSALAYRAGLSTDLLFSAMAGTPVNTAQPNERKLNFWERLYLPEVLKGLGYTGRKMRVDPYTFEYPEEQWYPPDSYRGRPVLVEEQGRPRCVSCNLCARACPPLAISMQAREVDDDIKEREPAWFEINMLRCIYCGYCEEVCPEEAIVMSKEYDMTFQHRDEAHFGLERLLTPKEELRERLGFLEARRNGQFGEEQWAYPEQNNIHTLRNRLAFLAEAVTDDAAAPDPQGPGAERGGPADAQADIEEAQNA